MMLGCMGWITNPCAPSSGWPSPPPVANMKTGRRSGTESGVQNLRHVHRFRTRGAHSEVHSVLREPLDSDTPARVDTTTPGREVANNQRTALTAEVRTLIRRIGVAVTASQYEHARAVEALERVSAQLACADQIDNDIRPFGDGFLETYEQLRETTQALSRANRQASTAPEQTVKMLKSLFEDSRTTLLSPDATLVVERDVVRWGIEGYFAA
jgi:hypothetical protein